MNKDLRFGLLSEQMVIKQIKDNFGDDYEKIKDKFHPYDFKDKNDNYIELKTRRCFHNTYPTTMIGYNKLKYASDRPHCNFKFLFKFNDGLYFHEYHHDKPYEIKNGGRWDRGKNEISEYAYIPINELIKVQKQVCTQKSPHIK